MPTLTSITVSPTNPFVLTGGTQAFTATAHFSDAADLDITTNSSTVWASSLTAVATISTSGINKGTATALTISGSTIISATYNSKVGTTILRVGLASYTRILEPSVENTKNNETSFSAPHNPVVRSSSANFSMFSGGITLQNNVGVSGGTPIGWTVASSNVADTTKIYIANEELIDGYWVQINSDGYATSNLTTGQRSLGVVSSISVDSNGNQLTSGGNPVIVQFIGEAYVRTSDPTIVLGSFLVPDTSIAGHIKATSFNPSTPTSIVGYALESFNSSTYSGMVLMRLQLCGE